MHSKVLLIFLPLYLTSAFQSLIIWYISGLGYVLPRRLPETFVDFVFFFQCSDSTHGTRTLAKHRRIPLSEKPREKPKCPYHTSHVTEFTCLEKECQSSPLMCYICKDYGRHKGHAHNLLELEAEKWRSTVSSAVQHLKKFVDDVKETARRLDRIQQEIVPDRLPEQGPGTADKAKQRVRSYFQSLRDQLNR